jgi:23S rRNA pseudouridine1911/1915/1917 synthase
VRVNGWRYRKGEAIRAGDQVEVLPEASAASLAKSKISLEILYEDDGLLIVAKPPMLPCHPRESNEEATVITLLARDYPEVAEFGEKPFEGALVHRLDNGTSGALMIARTRESRAFMREALRAGRILRRYEALIEGRLESPAELNWTVAHHRKNPARMVIADGLPMPADATRSQRIVRAPYRGTPREAFSRVEPIRQIGAFTLVDVIPQTGRRHQIRVHLAGAGRPIANDELYGGPKSAPLEQGRFWLHLKELRFTSLTGHEVQVIAPRPADLGLALAGTRVS